MVWKIHLFGAFRLFDPESNAVDLKSKKLEALLAMLLVSKPYGLSREEICEALWPDTESKQSLRQAIYGLRKVLGANAIEATNDRCRISDTFEYECDLAIPTLRSSDVFMPDACGDWFDLARMECDSSDSTPTATDGFVATLHWYAQNDAREFYRVLKSSVNMARGIPFNILKMLSDLAFSSSPESIGWSYFWQATAEENLATATKLLHLALAEARTSKDIELASEVTLEMGRAYARRGNSKMAMQASSIAETLAQSSNLARVKANGYRLKGTVLSYYGQPERGINEMIKGESFIEDTVGLAYARSSRAFFMASVGWKAEALETLDWSLKASSGLGHQRISYLADITKSIAETIDGPSDNTIRSLEGFLEDSKRSGFTQLGVCAADLLATIYAKAGQSEVALSKARSANWGRSMSLAVKTPMEVLRQDLVVL